MHFGFKSAQHTGAYKKPFVKIHKNTYIIFISMFFFAHNP
jgi:hypothetical protein